jgi:hypothetical protein
VGITSVLDAPLRLRAACGGLFLARGIKLFGWLFVISVRR